eukprot:169440-Chlamydomonas_euryale.AAC.3
MDAAACVQGGRRRFRRTATAQVASAWKRTTLHKRMPGVIRYCVGSGFECPRRRLPKPMVGTRR